MIKYEVSAFPFSIQRVNVRTFLQTRALLNYSNDQQAAGAAYKTIITESQNNIKS